MKKTDYEIISTRRERFADGRRGWSGVLRQRYAMDATVVGSRDRWMRVPQQYRVGQAGAHQERRYAATITPDDIPYYDECG